MVPRITLLLLLSAVVVAAVAYGIENRVVNAYGRLPSLRFLHVPKTGTSFIISLRNYLDACEVKDKTCSGDHGGSDLTVRFANDTPFYIEACDGQLEACSKSAYHMHWRYTFQGNYVTLLREPGEQAVSGFVYTNALLQAANKTQMAAEEYVRRHHNLHVKVGGEGRGGEGGQAWLFCGCCCLDAVRFANIVSTAVRSLSRTRYAVCDALSGISITRWGRGTPV